MCSLVEMHVQKQGSCACDSLTNHRPWQFEMSIAMDPSNSEPRGALNVSIRIWLAISISVYPSLSIIYLPSIETYWNTTNAFCEWILCSQRELRFHSQPCRVRHTWCMFLGSCDMLQLPWLRRLMIWAPKVLESQKRYVRVQSNTHLEIIFNFGYWWWNYMKFPFEAHSFLYQALEGLRVSEFVALLQ